jgi:hypothetical protein
MILPCRPAASDLRTSTFRITAGFLLAPSASVGIYAGSGTCPQWPLELSRWRGGRGRVRRSGILLRKPGRIFLSQTSEMLGSTHPDGAEVLSSFIETGTIRTATVFGIGKLDGVVFPPTHFANQPRAWWLFVQSEVAAARAQVPVHRDIVGHRKEIFCDLTSSTCAGRAPAPQLLT